MMMNHTIQICELTQSTCISNNEAFPSIYIFILDVSVRHLTMTPIYIYMSMMARKVAETSYLGSLIVLTVMEY